MKDYSTRYPHFKVYKQENLGVSIARNTAIEQAKGEYIGFADSDDYVSSDFIEVLYTKARLHDADMVQCSYQEMSEEREHRVFTTPNRVLGIEDENERGSYVSGFVWRSLYRKACFEKVRFPERFWYEDMINRMVFMRTLARIVVTDDVLYFKCSRTDSEAVIQAKGVADTRKIDQYWLAKSLVEFTTIQLGFPVNDAQYRQLLREWGGLLWTRIGKLDKRCRKKVFLLAASYLVGLQYHCTQLSDLEKTLEKALVTGNYLAWRLIAIASKLI